MLCKFLFDRRLKGVGVGLEPSILFKALIFIKIQVCRNEEMCLFGFQKADFPMSLRFRAVSLCQASVSGGTVRRPD